MTAPVAFDDVARALAAGGSSVHAAEAHGCLCGAFSTRRQYLPSEWLEEILPEVDEPGDEVRAALGSLYVASYGALEGDDLEFTPLLPDDETGIDLRIEALAAWCQGFLYGFGTAGTLPRASLGDDVQEFLADLAELSRAGAVEAVEAEVEEQAYADLVEYLRVGVQLAYDQLAALRAAQPDPAIQH